MLCCIMASQAAWPPQPAECSSGQDAQLAKSVVLKGCMSVCTSLSQHSAGVVSGLHLSRRPPHVLCMGLTQPVWQQHCRQHPAECSASQAASCPTDADGRSLQHGGPGESRAHLRQEAHEVWGCPPVCMTPRAAHAHTSIPVRSRAAHLAVMAPTAAVYARGTSTRAQGEAVVSRPMAR